MTKNSEAISLIFQAVQQHNYPISYQGELLRFLGISTSEKRELSGEQEISLQHILVSLSKQMPVEYIVGEALFCERYFKVTRDVLIPRFDTEQLVTKSIGIANDLDDATIIDIGTGSGAIIVSLAKALTKFLNGRFVAMDTSSAALSIAQENAQRHQVADKIDFILADTIPTDSEKKPLIPETKYVLIVSNPPYISDENMELLPDSVKNYEPELALRKQKNFIGKLQKYINLLKENKKTIYCAFEYSNNKGAVIFRYATPLQVGLQALLSS
ncbi:peptide chain release factor N(5)-glutamine methyltransferase [bacterium]|nr:peptide chain release factor N(5)-glutamine methyltransferase [bacterium]